MEKHANRYDYYIIMPHFKIDKQGQNNFSGESLEVIKGFLLRNSSLWITMS